MTVAEALKGNPDVTLVELPGLNHLFQTATTGSVGEYRDIEETFGMLLTGLSVRYYKAVAGEAER